VVCLPRRTAPVLIYPAAKELGVEQSLDGALRQLSASIEALKQLEESGAALNGHSLSWKDMATTVSGCLRGVYNTLTAVSGQILEDPTQYSHLLSSEWFKIQTNTTEVLNILAGKGVNTSSERPSPLPVTSASKPQPQALTAWQAP
jgi:hypothetical protein